MPDSDLPAVLKLMDDENPTVREAIKRKLASYGPELQDAISEALPEASPDLLRRATSLQRDYERDLFLDSWGEWLLEPSSTYKLERGQALLSSFLTGTDAQPKVTRLLDGIAEEFRTEHPVYDFTLLADYLFDNDRFRGDESRYYHPDNSNFLTVLQKRHGNPISLACVFILVGRRLGMTVGGCNYPAHFLARAVSEADGKLYLVDCFNSGRVIAAEDLIRHHPLASKEVEGVVLEPASTETIVARVLRNLENAYGQINQPEQQRFVRRLWSRMAEGE